MGRCMCQLEYTHQCVIQYNGNRMRELGNTASKQQGSLCESAKFEKIVISAREIRGPLHFRKFGLAKIKCYTVIVHLLFYRQQAQLCK